MCPSSAQMAEQQALNRAALPEHAEEGRQKPKRGLTFELSGAVRRPLERWVRFVPPQSAQLFDRRIEGGNGGTNDGFDLFGGDVRQAT